MRHPTENWPVPSRISSSKFLAAPAVPPALPCLSLDGPQRNSQSGKKGVSTVAWDEKSKSTREGKRQKEVHARQTEKGNKFFAWYHISRLYIP